MLNCPGKKILFLILFSIVAALPACKDHPENKTNQKSVLVSKKITAVQKKVSGSTPRKKIPPVKTAKTSDTSILKDKRVPEKQAKLSQGENIVTAPDKEKKFYSSEGRIDPFEPLVRPKQKKESLNTAEGQTQEKPRLILTPLMKLDFSQMRLVAVVMAESGNIAMVEDSTHKGYSIRIGTYIGKNGGRVVKIDKNRVIIMEHIKNFKGEIVERSHILKLHKPGDEG